ncbi:MAG: hypothetical protein IJ111_01340 [Eggerthellaceae bacterium]|nr:hypothetical protein [Eggerthellaceae bacterium]
MSNKKQRMAWNLTKLADLAGITRSGENYETFIALYEIAHDNGLACIELSRFDLDGGLVFVPDNEWRQAWEEKKSREKLGFLDPEWPQVHLARKYRNDAMKHEF